MTNEEFATKLESRSVSLHKMWKNIVMKTFLIYSHKSKLPIILTKMENMSLNSLEKLVNEFKLQEIQIFRGKTYFD